MHCSISAQASGHRERDEALWAWFERALADVGYRWVGRGRTFHSKGWRRCWTFRGPAAPVMEAMRGLWENERPGCALTLRCEYDARQR